MADINKYVNTPRKEWDIVYFDGDVQEAILAFPPELQAQFVHLTERMLAFGPDLGMPHTRAMGKGLFELRLKGKWGIGRVFFLPSTEPSDHDAARLREEVCQDIGE